MPVSIHKMLMHGAQIIEELPISIGHSSEEAIEATHKKLRYAKEHHTLKTNRRRINASVLWIETEQRHGNLKIQSERNSYNYSSINYININIK